MNHWLHRHYGLVGNKPMKKSERDRSTSPDSNPEEDNDFVELEPEEDSASMQPHCHHMGYVFAAGALSGFAQSFVSLPADIMIKNNLIDTYYAAIQQQR